MKCAIFHRKPTVWTSGTTNAKTSIKITFNDEDRRNHSTSISFAELTNRKVRPAVVVCETKDKYRDLTVCAISSVVPPSLNEHEILLLADQTNKLRAKSVIKVDRIVTVKRRDVIAQIGRLDKYDLEKFKETFKQLVD